ncbi:MAG TPA: PIG-L family deacetylase [Anaerolineales bacterium]
MTSKRRTLLAVFAHPDDESFGPGGTLALYARQGHRVVLLCATRGEAGTVDAEYLKGFASISDLREAELRCAAQHLGLEAVHFMGYRDSGMPGQPANTHLRALIVQPIDHVAGQIVKHIRALKPDVVLTFDPIGGYRHPDHIHMHQATNLAFERSADPSFYPEAGEPFSPPALFYYVLPNRLLRLITRLMPLVGIDPRRWGRNKDIDLVSLTAFEFPIHVRINIAPVAKIKAQAGACHASQGGIQMRRGLMAFIMGMLGETESFMRAFPPVDTGHRISRDLFEGA